MTGELGKKANLTGATFTGAVAISGGADLSLTAPSGSSDPGDLVFRAGTGQELGRVWMVNATTLAFSASAAPTAGLTVTGTRAGVGASPHPTFGLNVAGGVVTDNWFRSTGPSGWINDTYGGGLYMMDTTWVRMYGGKNLYLDVGTLRTDGELHVGPSGSVLRVSAATSELNVNSGTLYANGSHVSVGSASIENNEGWNRVLQLQGTSHARFALKTSTVDAGAFVHASGIYGASSGMIVGTKTSHNLSFITAGSMRAVLTSAGNFGIGTGSPGARLHVAGEAQFDSTVTVSTAASNAMFVGRQVGAGYSQSTRAIFRAESDNTVSTVNVAFEALRGATRTFSVTTAGAVTAATVETASVTVGTYRWEYNAVTGSMDLVTV
nr:shufflon system plasmid conjugative transfer pilus tip adhesin PilV [Deinococcus sp. 6YEL10]